MFAVRIRTLEDVEHVLLGFVVFNTLLLLFTVWGLKQGQKTIDRLNARDIEHLRLLEELKQQPP